MSSVFKTSTLGSALKTSGLASPLKTSGAWLFPPGYYQVTVTSAFSGVVTSAALSTQSYSTLAAGRSAVSDSYDLDSSTHYGPTNGDFTAPWWSLPWNVSFWGFPQDFVDALYQNQSGNYAGVKVRIVGAVHGTVAVYSNNTTAGSGLDDTVRPDSYSYVETVDPTSYTDLFPSFAAVLGRYDTTRFWPNRTPDSFSWYP